MPSGWYLRYSIAAATVGIRSLLPFQVPSHLDRKPADDGVTGVVDAEANDEEPGEKGPVEATCTLLAPAEATANGGEGCELACA